MSKALLSILNVVEGEEKPVLLLLGYGFFMGIFLAAYKIVATTLFLSSLSEYIREAFFVSGVLGVVATWTYSSIQNRVQYSKLIIFNIISIFIFIAFARVMFEFYNSQWLAFILFVMLGPITSVLLLGFWGIFGRLFDLRQSKRIIGGIDSGQLTAIIITTFSIPFIIPFMADIRDILLIGEVGLAISGAFYIILSINFKLSSFHDKQKEDRRETSFLMMFKNRYIVYLSLFLFLSMSAFVLVDYSFMNVTEQQYPNVKQLASFLGVFEGSIMVLSLLLQTFANEKILSMYGMKTSLLLLPIILFIFTALAIMAGYFYGFDITSPTFIWFFLFIALSKLFVTTLREATESPVFKLFFMPLNSRIRFDIQTKLEGTVTELSRAVTGGLILMFGLIPFFKLIHYSWILTGIIIIWVVLLYKISNLYKINIRLKLEKQKEEADKIEQKGRNLLVTKLFSSIDTNTPNLMVFALRVLSKIAPDTFKSKIEEIKNDHSIVSNNKVLKTLESDFSFIHIANLKSYEENGDENVATGKNNYSSFDEQLMSMIKSRDFKERKLAAELVSATKSEKSNKMLIELLNDKNSDVINAAILTASELRKLELLPFVIDNFCNAENKEASITAIINFGLSSFPQLEILFNNTDQSVKTKKNIINIYGKVGGEDAIELLWKKIDYPDKNIVSQVLLSLSHCGFTAEEDQIQRIKIFIEDDIVEIIWNLKAIVQIKDYGTEFKNIVEALYEENEHNYSHIYLLLAMIFDQKSIQLVKENIETKTNEGISYAIELLDVFLSDDLKQKIIPVLDDTSDLDRIRRLQMFYPFIEVSLDELIRQIINKEFNAINRWTKACMIHYLGENKISEKYDMELIANLFNPDQLLKETSAWSMNEIDKQFYMENLRRLELEDINHLKNLKITDRKNIASELKPHMKSELISFLKNESLLGELPNYIIASIVDHIEEVYIEGEAIIEQSEWHNGSFYFLYDGYLEAKSKEGKIIDQFKKGDFLGEQINIDLQEEFSSISIKGDTVLLRIEKNRFLDLITNEYDVTLTLLDSFSSQRETNLIQ